MTIATIGTVLGVGASLFEGFQGYQAGQYRAKVAEFNQDIAKQNADRAIERSQVEQQDQDAITLAALGEQLASQGASGLAITGRSNTALRKNAATLGRLDALRIRQGGQLEAYNYNVDAANFGAEAGAARSSGAGSLVSGFLNAGTSLIGGAGKVKNPARYTTPEAYSARLPRPRPLSLVR